MDHVYSSFTVPPSLSLLFGLTVNIMSLISTALLHSIHKYETEKPHIIITALNGSTS